MSNKKGQATGTAKAKATKTAKVAEVEAVVETTPVVEAVTVHSCRKCGADEALNDAGVSNFSLIKATGKPSIYCKACQIAKSKEWTSRPDVAEMRKVQALARQYQKAGIPALVPDAKTYEAGQPIMTVAYSEVNGAWVPDGTEGATFHPSVNATELYEALVAERTAEREARKAEAEETRAAMLAENKRIREEARAAKQAELKEQAEARKAEREKAREQKILEVAEANRLKAEERQRKAAEATARKAAEAAQKALQVKADREAKATQAALARAGAIDAENQHALEALRGSATV